MLLDGLGSFFVKKIVWSDCSVRRWFVCDEIAPCEGEGHNHSIGRWTTK